ncbi:MAG: 30S ribosomal protein S12 methylthiotransferase RimO [Clostridia bacterium]|nr:30S ribosomal protein S12 methylthiotransferase RimO [Clostridia bacterium]
MNKYKIGLVSLGCPKNEVDAEVMLKKIAESGHEIENDPAKCDVVIINTCGFLQSSKQEAIETIFEMSDLKGSTNLKKIIVSGCFSGRYSQVIYDEMPEVDTVLGVSQYPDIVSHVERCLNGERYVCAEINEAIIGESGRVLTTPPHRAYLKISEGCSNNCTYCAIPSIRGGMRSRGESEILDEAKLLIEKGVKEITLVAQDTTRYGEDIGKSLAGLLDKMASIDKNVWIRVLYMYPEMVTDELLSVYKKHENICRYMDIPLQHVSDKILKLMNRHANKAGIIETYHKIKTAFPEMTLRTTYITGFPGETQQDFDELAEFVSKYPFDNVGVFSYSREEGTPAYKMKNQVADKVKDERRDLLLQYQSTISEDLMSEKVGKKYKVLVESRENGYYVGRSQDFTAEIDGEILIESSSELAIGEFYDVSITASSMYDLQGRIINENDNRK